MIALHETLKALATRRPAFHSEADFQHELAMQICQNHPDVSVRLEVPMLEIGAIDIILRHRQNRMLIELKYKPHGGRLTWDNEVFDLRRHGAVRDNRYKALKDIERVEKSQLPGCAIFMTDMPTYWSARPARGNGANFSLHQDRKIDPGLLQWAKGQTAPLEIRGNYTLNWQDYSKVGDHQFRYLATVVAGGNG